MPRHPAHIGRTPEHIAVLQVEHPQAGELGIEQVAGAGVLDALGLAGGTRGIEQE